MTPWKSHPRRLAPFRPTPSSSQAPLPTLGWREPAEARAPCLLEPPPAGMRPAHGCPAVPEEHPSTDPLQEGTVGGSGSHNAPFISTKEPKLTVTFFFKD